MNEEEIARYLTNWQDEVESAALYRALTAWPSPSQIRSLQPYTGSSYALGTLLGVAIGG